MAWESGAGILELPDGRRIRGRGLRHGEPEDPPDFGLYLLGKSPPPMAWESRWIKWPDFRLPADVDAARAAFREVYDRSGSERVEVACGGGRGRTGTTLACIAILAGVPAEEAVVYVREHYDRHAVETPWQRRFVRRFHA
jgi:protein-tyrosine phosphatase